MLSYKLSATVLIKCTAAVILLGPSFSVASSASNNNESIAVEDEPTTGGHTKSHYLQRQHASAPELKVFEDIFTHDQMDAADRYFNQIDHLDGQYTWAQLEHMTLITRVHSLVYTTAYTHRYDNYHELKKAGGPQADQEVCLRQLEQLNQRLDRLSNDKLESRDINLYQLLDTYEWFATGSLLGDHEWPGNYNECLRLKINSTSDGLVSTRYCSASFKRSKWPKSGKLNELLALKASVCLPKACDSIQYKNKYELIERLVKFNARRVDELDASLHYLYCLPDEESPLRLWYYSSKTTAFVGAIALWLAMLIYATVKYEKLSTEQEEGGVKQHEHEQPKQHHRSLRIYRSLSLIHNAKSLFQISSPPKSNEETELGDTEQVVDLGVLEGIKVIAMCYVITGHVLMFFTMIMKNGREMSIININNMSFFSANMMPGLAVNAFFTITGILATYLLFKNSEPTKLVTSPSKWFAFVVYRYIRIMPLYIIVIMYTKYLAKYLGAGPFWDYGTSSLGSRRQCEQEPWFWILSFTANLKPPLDHCIPSAWYLANDFQFFLVTPIFLALLQKRPRFGKLLIIAASIAGYAAAMLNIATSNVDLRPLATFMPHGFKTYVIFLSETYTMPHYRVPAYLCGLLIGYALYRYEQDMLQYHKLEAAKKTGGEDDTNIEELKKPNWPEGLKKYGTTFCLTVVASCFALPFVGDLLQSNKFYSKILVAGFMPTYHLLFAVSTGLYVLLATTGHGNKALNNFLSSPIWKPFSRLSLCVVLTNIEVITYFCQSSTQMLYMDFKIHTALNLFCIVMSYLVATVVCLTFESPLRATINHLVASMVKGLTTKQKSD